MTDLNFSDYAIAFRKRERNRRLTEAGKFWLTYLGSQTIIALILAYSLTGGSHA